MTTTDVLIRDAQVEEAATVLAIWNEAFGAEPAPSTLPSLQRLILNDHDARVLLAAVDGHAVGALLVTFDGWRGHLYRLAVLPGMQRRGIARALVQTAEQWLNAVGCEQVNAVVEDASPWLGDFWSAIGYHLEGEMRRYARAIG